MDKFGKRFPYYFDDSDYQTNAPSYYDDLARKQKLIRLLAEKIWEYEETLDLTLEELSERLETYIDENNNLMKDRLDEWDLNLEKFPENVELLLQEWLSDGTLDHIINETIFNWKADKTYVDSEIERLDLKDENLTTHLDQIVQKQKNIWVDVKEDFGAMGVDFQDDTVSVQNAINYVHEHGGGTVYFPEGEYGFRFNENKIQKHFNTCLVIPSNVKIVGKNKLTTKLKIIDVETSWLTLFDIWEVENLYISGITFDGNRYEVYDNQQMHIFYIESSKNIVINDCHFKNPRGDSILIRGTEYPSENIQIQNSYFEGAGRNSITMGSGFKNVKIRDSIFFGNTQAQHIDFEPETGYYTSYVEISGNSFDGTDGGGVITFESTVNSVSDNSIITFINNDCLNTELNFTYGVNVYVKNNRLKFTENHVFYRYPFTLMGNMTNITISENTIICPVEITIFEISSLQERFPNDITIRNNYIESFGFANIQNAKNVKILNNKAINIGTTNKTAFDIRPTIIDMENIVIKGNEISSYSTAFNFQMSNEKRCDQLKIKDNIIKDCSDFGFTTLNKSLDNSDDFIYDNNVHAGVKPTTPFKWANGAYYKTNSTGGMLSEILYCKGSPEGVYVGGVGSIAINVDGGLNNTMFIKETGNGNTGWIAK